MPKDIAKDGFEIDRAVMRDQELRVGCAGRLTEEEHDLGGFAWCERQWCPQNAARIEARAHATRERARACRERGRIVERSVPAHELPPVACPAFLPASHVHERHP